MEVLDGRLGNIEGLVGRRVEAVSRRGKYLRLSISGGLLVELHLRMSGRLFWQKRTAPPRSPDPSRNGGALSNGGEGDGTDPLFPAYSRLVIAFPAGTLTLIDPRRFATLTVQAVESKQAIVEDAFEGLSARRLHHVARTRRLPVKAFLMDQRLIAGIGNIYACEILFAAGIDPRRPSSELSPADWRKVVKVSGMILERAIACRGTTVSDWQDLFGCGGSNQDHLAVYARDGEICGRCGGRIERIRQGGRGTWYCPSCQR